ncbi:MAG: hypothetical protein IT221_11750 [Fluviicola sp.]|nr:hypothetical protein [Fluviicola sp.]
MRPLYFLLKVSLHISFRLFYKRFKVVNNPKSYFGRTIYVSNHPNSFMDPLVIGSLGKPIVHFMTRSDVFKWWLKPVLWSSHMLPIYRQHDGENTKTKNKDVFNKVNRALSVGRNILIFGEGFTDDIPIRGLKPIKKGPIRMGFTALEASNWKKKIYVCPMGLNYTDRNTIGSEVVINYGQRICLNDYKEQFNENGNKLINELTKKLEQGMQECVIYVHDKNWYTFLENIMQLTRKGYNHANHDDEIELLDRLAYSKALATWINENVTEENEAFVALKKDMDAYFSLEKRMKVEDRFVIAKEQPQQLSRTKELLLLLTTWPLAIVGFLHGFIPYIVAKKVTEKIMKRKVFWGSVKMMLAKLIGSLYNIPIIIVLTHYCFPHWSLGIVYFLIVAPCSWRISYAYVHWFNEYRLKGMMAKADLSKFEQKRAELVKRIHELIPVA